MHTQIPYIYLSFLLAVMLSEGAEAWRNERTGIRYFPYREKTENDRDDVLSRRMTPYRGCAIDLANPEARRSQEVRRREKGPRVSIGICRDNPVN